MRPKDLTEQIIKLKAEDIIYERIGTSVGAGMPVKEVIENKIFWKIPIEADYPRIVNDQKDNTFRYTVLHLGKVGEMIFDEETNPIEIPRRITLDSKISEELLRIYDRISELLLKTESSKFARIVSTRHLSSPLSNIITNVLFYDRYTISNPDSKLGLKILKDAKILEQRNFIRINNDILEPSGDLRELYNKSGEDIEFTLERVITDVIENESLFMGQLYFLSPYIKVPTSYYDHALSVQSLITLSKEDLWDVYCNNYGYTARNRFRFADWLRVLTSKDVQILEKTNFGYRGDETVFDIMADSLYEKEIPIGLVL